MPRETRGARGAATPNSPSAGPEHPSAAHTEAELTSVLGLLRNAGVRYGSVVVGHGRGPRATAAAHTFAERWRSDGGTVLDVVDWPEQAASWLRQARRFTAAAPDAWVVAAGPHGWAGMSRRLRLGDGWDPARTFGFGSTGTARAAALVEPGTLTGLCGATPDGDTWRIDADSRCVRDGTDPR